MVERGDPRRDDKRAIGDAGVNQWRQAFDAKISG